jgi:hypothetical protein
MTVTNNIDQKQIKYHVFNAVMNSELTELVPVFTIRPAFPSSVKKVNTSFKNVWLTWGPALPTLLADLMIFCPLGPIGPTNFKNSDTVLGKYISSLSDTLEQVDKPYRPTQKLYFLYSGREQIQ